MDIINIILIALVVFLLFMAGRELVCWYLKINERIKLHQETNNLLQTHKELMLRKLLHDGIVTQDEIDQEEK
jgi:hypothetical protein